MLATICPCETRGTWDNPEVHTCNGRGSSWCQHRWWCGPLAVETTRPGWSNVQTRPEAMCWSFDSKYRWNQYHIGVRTCHCIVLWRFETSCWCIPATIRQLLLSCIIVVVVVVVVTTYWIGSLIAGECLLLRSCMGPSRNQPAAQKVIQLVQWWSAQNDLLIGTASFSIFNSGTRRGLGFPLGCTFCVAWGSHFGDSAHIQRVSLVSFHDQSSPPKLFPRFDWKCANFPCLAKRCFLEMNQWNIHEKGNLLPQVFSLTFTVTRHFLHLSLHTFWVGLDDCTQTWWLTSGRLRNLNFEYFNGRNRFFVFVGVIFILWNFGHVFISGFPVFIESLKVWNAVLHVDHLRLNQEKDHNNLMKFKDQRSNDYQEVYRERMTWLLRGGFAQVLRHFPKWIWCLAEASIDL